MDEPAASVSAKEARPLLQAIHDLPPSGVAVLHVPHRSGEILDLCPRITVSRNDRSVADRRAPG